MCDPLRALPHASDPYISELIPGLQQPAPLQCLDARSKTRALRTQNVPPSMLEVSDARPGHDVLDWFHVTSAGLFPPGPVGRSNCSGLSHLELNMIGRTNVPHGEVTARVNRRQLGPR